MNVTGRSDVFLHVTSNLNIIISCFRQLYYHLWYYFVVDVFVFNFLAVTLLYKLFMNGSDKYLIIDYAREQADEVEAISSIFPDDFNGKFVFFKIVRRCYREISCSIICNGSSYY